MDRIVVVGASLAGLRACESLRAAGYTGTITVIGAEPHMPYDRPPLSKALLKGEWEPERIQLRKPDELGRAGARPAARRQRQVARRVTPTVTLQTGESSPAMG